VRIFLVALLLISAIAKAADFESRYYAAVFSGDLSWVTAAEPDSPAGLALQEKFDALFVRGVRDSAIKAIDDIVVRRIAERFADYWRQAFLAPQDLGLAEAQLLTDIARLVGAEDQVDDPAAVERALADLLDQRGFYYRGGRTRPLLDLMLWRKNRTVDYDVELTDGRQDVVVHFLDEFAVRGWSFFATFGRSGTGGWADRDALYCISAAYDVDSEQFENSYLRHEARHFADYELFPALDGADLEYRGKLTELAFSSDASGLLSKFWRHSDGTSVAPHPLANWYVVQDTARAFDKSCDDNPLICIGAATNDDLQAAARRLLKNHSRELNGLGAATVRSTLTPVAAD